MLTFNAFIWVIGLMIVAAGLLIAQSVYRKPVSWLLVAGLFGIYMLNVIRYTFFPFPIHSQLIELMRTAMGEHGMVRLNLIPFHSQYYSSIFQDKSNYLNIVMTVPYGILLPLLIPMHRKRMLLYALGIGVTIEVLQGLLNLVLGYTYRTVDINDVIFNFIGAMIGWELLRLLCQTTFGKKRLARWLPVVVKK
ncbi:VanZ family protein [Paenibacillus hunanensis]|uniref:VanZ family protein n=1 Tax=Paenibacillus hunanensis TaxID=539262 RepID=UPI002A6A7C3A|nr:VanZ family protein [Paenibacillus hunanensis]WPP41853.1 VanZ family protein [Paenibacillus hunanensis]